MSTKRGDGVSGPTQLRLAPLSLHRQVPSVDPPSNMVEPPGSADDQAKIRHWRDCGFQAEARLAERDRQVQKQNIDILDLSWKASTERNGLLGGTPEGILFLETLQVPVLRPTGETDPETCRIRSRTS